MSLRFRQLEKLERVREETESLQRELDAREDVIKSAGSPKSGPDASGQPSRGSAGRKSLRERVHVGEPGGLAGRNFKSIDAGTPSAHGALPADFGMPRDTHVFAPQGETALHDLQNAALFEESISSGAPAARIGDAHWLAAKRRSGDLRYRYLIPPDYVAVGGAAQGGLPGSAVQGDGAPGGFHRSAVQHQPTAEATAPEDTANVQDFEKTELVGRGEPHDDLAEDLWDWEGVSRRPAVSREAPANRKKGAPRRRKGAPAPSAGQEKRPRVDKAASGELAGQATMGPSLADVLAHGPDEPLLLREEGPDPSSGTALEKVVPASINRYLRGYQREGVRFLFRQYAKGEGGILADDMGLGKTVQTIAFVAAILPSPVSTAPAPPNSQATPTRSGPVLIVVPTSLLTNWEREFNMWGTFRIAIYHGINRGASLTAAASGNLQVLLTSYDTVRLYIEDLLTVDWHVVICDEAHRLKNDRSKIYSCASKFPTKLRYGLTGTPMQNSYEELWTLLEWARPGALGSASQFREYYAKPLKEGQRSDADLRMLAKAKKRQVQLTKVLNKYLLRRTKEGSIKDQLPTKTDHIVFCALSPLQARAYRDPNPNVSSYESHPASGQLATHSRRNDETDPTNDKISLHIFLSNDGLVQKPLEPLQQGQRISMQPSKCFKSEGLESHRRLLTRQQDSIAGLLVLGSARGGPTRHEVQQVGNCEWGRANDVDIKVTPLLPRMEAEVCATALLARDRGGKGGFPGDPLTS
eukprot:jgi/Botrbrau1/15213/Bobra.0149s0068.5